MQKSVVVVLLFFCSSAYGQTSPDYALTVSLGGIEVFSSHVARDGFALYPELELYATIYRAGDAGITFGGSIYGAAWYHDGEGGLDCADCIVYAQKAALAGGRALIRLDHFPLPLSFWAGASFRAVRSDLVEGGWSGADETYSRGEFGVETGARLEIPLSPSFNLQPRAHVILPATYEENSPESSRYALAVGLNYRL